MGGNATHQEDQAEGLGFAALRGAEAAIFSFTVADAIELPAAAFEAATVAIYARLERELRGAADLQPIRLWNFIPAILEPLGGLPHRYMVFNAGRFQALERWFDGPEAFSTCVPTASGVGHAGGDLVVHCLAAQRPGRPVENPRQVSSYCYSRKYGPLPPCFARATRVEVAPGAAPWLRGGGTASVAGEDSVHDADLRSQARETFLNLAALVRQALGQQPAPGPDDGLEHAHLLACYRHLRVYHTHALDLPLIMELVGTRFKRLLEVEYLEADLCRPELLVEIEGVAELPLET